MKEKTYYYHFKKTDASFWAMLIALIWAIASCCCCFCCSKYSCCDCYLAWIMFAFATLLWGYKNVLKQKAIVITDKDIKIDHSNPISWKDIKDAEVKVVKMCCGSMKVLSLIPKKEIKYHYNWLQKHNGDFGAFPIPLYGILSPDDEKEIIQLVEKHVKIKCK